MKNINYGNEKVIAQIHPANGVHDKKVKVDSKRRKENVYV